MVPRSATSSNRTLHEKNPGRIWPPWYTALSTYRNPSNRIAWWQLANTFLPYCGLWALMILSIQRGYSYAVTLITAAVASLFLVRLFILFHDCVHGSLFSQKGLNTFFGHALGLLVFTPFEDWRVSHLRHHATYANLDARGFGDIWTMTRREYEEATPGKRLSYRLYRHPLVLIGLGALFSFLLRYRLPARKSKRKVHISVMYTNVLLAAVVLTAVFTMGWRTYLLIQLPVIWLAGAMGIWLFYVQHQFKRGYWARKQNWNPIRAALEGSSFYKLPIILLWFSANIGYHHVHHLNPRIPNYRLKQCCNGIAALRDKKPLSIKESLPGIHLKLWDEENKELVGFP